ncbi:MAG: Flp family type IVb pilin [Planctomycetales bacterium]|nr:Flp family type IVb pilin [Planctomycetales bacterium]
MSYTDTRFRCANLVLRFRSQSKSQFARRLRRFLISEDGPTAVEYAVMLALIVVVCLTAISAIGTNASTTFKSIGDQLGGS